MSIKHPSPLRDLMTGCAKVIAAVVLLGLVYPLVATTILRTAHW